MRRRPHEFWCEGCKSIKSKMDFLYRKDGRRRSYCNCCRKSQMKSYWNERGGREKKKEYLKENGIRVDRLKQENAKSKDPMYFIKKQARYTVYNQTRTGKLPRAKDLSCVDCGNMANEYDHHMGYDEENWLNVEPVCYNCHQKRTQK